MKWIFWPNKNGDIKMVFTDQELKFTLLKAKELQKWTDLVRQKQRLPSAYPDTLTYRLSITSKLNLHPILDRLRLVGKDGYAKQIEDARDNLINEVKNYEKNYDKNDPMHLPDFSLCDTADRLVILLRKVFNDETDDSKKLSMYADNIEDLVSDDLTLYTAIWNKQFQTLLNIAVGYDLFDALLDRIEEKDKASGEQLRAKYQQLKESFDVENAQEKELKAIKSAAFNMVSLMKKVAEKKSHHVKKPAETEQEIPPAREEKADVNIHIAGGIQAENVQIGNHASIHKQPKAEETPKFSILGWIRKKIYHLVGAIIVGLIVAILIDIFGDFGWLEQIKAFIYKILRVT